jgi:hypothetical protein
MRGEMNNAERKKRRAALEANGFTFKYVRGNAEVGSGYDVYHKGSRVGGGREVSLDEAIEWAEKQSGEKLALRKFLMG